MKPETSWKRAYREYLNGHNGHGDPLSFEEFRGRLSPLSGEKFSKPENTPTKPPTVRQPEPNTSDDPLDYDLNAEGATGALVPANSKKKTPLPIRTIELAPTSRWPAGTRAKPSGRAFTVPTMWARSKSIALGATPGSPASTSAATVWFRGVAIGASRPKGFWTTTWSGIHKLGN
jgi:hypothetical protein